MKIKIYEYKDYVRLGLEIFVFPSAFYMRISNVSSTFQALSS